MTGQGLMGLSSRDFWAQTLKEWLLRVEGWASQYDTADDAPTEEEHAEFVAGLTDEQRAWLGIAPQSAPH